MRVAGAVRMPRRKAKPTVVPADPRILALANRVAPKMRAAVIRALTALRQSIPLDVLEDALIAGTVTGPLREAMNGLAAALQPSVDLLTSTFQQAGTLAAAHLNRVVGIPLTFNASNPEAVAAAARYGARYVRYVDEDTQRTLRDLITRGMQGRTPPETARLLREHIGLTPRQAAALDNYRDRLIADGRSLGDVDRLAARYSQKLLNYRANVIARYETILASNRGQEELWRQGLESGEFVQGDVYRIWMTAEDERTCELCQPMDGKTADIGGTWDTAEGAVETPNEIHIQCRCAEALSFGAPPDRD